MNILIVRIGRMGDMVMVLPAIREIRRRYPRATLSAVTSSDGLRILPLVGIDVDHILVCRPSLRYRFSNALRVKRLIATSHFTHIFCFETKPRTVSWLPNWANVLPSQAKVQHYATRCLQLVTPTASSLLSEAPYQHVPVLAEEQSALETMLLDYDITPTTLVVGLHPTYSGFGKRGREKEKIHRLWSADNFSKLALALHQYAVEQGVDIKIVMSLLQSEQAIAADIVHNSQGAVIVLPVSPSIQAYLAYLQRLNVLVVPNTGVMHLAAALQTPMVALFSGYAPEDCGPYVAKDRADVICAEDFEKPELGLQAIPVEQVLKSTLRMLKQEY